MKNFTEITLDFYTGNLDENYLKNELQDYIDKNFLEELNKNFLGASAKKIYAPPPDEEDFFAEKFVENICFDAEKIDFNKIRDESNEETFSEKLIRLIKNSGEKNSVIYNRANIDRRHFSKICNHKNYQPTKLTALAFAIALKLNFEQTQDFLASAGYTLTKNNLADVIISFFIEKKIFDVDKVNNYLYDYKQPLLGG